MADRFRNGGLNHVACFKCLVNLRLTGDRIAFFGVRWLDTALDVWMFGCLDLWMTYGNSKPKGRRATARKGLRRLPRGALPQTVARAVDPWQCTGSTPLG